MDSLDNIPYTSISTDSRTLKPGALFVALIGENFDGHAYIDQAVAAGALAVVVSKPVQAAVPVITVPDTLQAYGQLARLHRDKFALPIAAITGSCGKTSVTGMLANILPNVLAPKGSFNNEIGVPKTLLELNQTHEYAVFEMGAKRNGDIKYLMSLVNPQVTMVNNVAPAHLESFGDLDNTARAKGEIYQYLQPTGVAVLNVDEVYAPFWLSLMRGQKVITFGLESKADITCAYIVEEHHQIKFALETDIGATEIVMGILGRHNVMNALAATAMARALGVSLDTIKHGLESYNPSTRRMQVKVGINGAKIIDDSYNANPIAMKKAIEVLAKQSGHKIMVVGDMLELGADAKQLHSTLGTQIKAAKIDQLFAFGDLAQHTAASYGTDAKFYKDKAALAADLLPLLSMDTVVLVKGSNGMHLEELIDVIVAK